MYGSFGQKQHASHALVAEAKERWKTPHTCFICGKQTIRYSHTIQMGGPIAAIAENGVVLHPVFRADGSVQMAPCGKGKASTFPGFCTVHEDMFKSFEQSKSITTPADIVLQTFRMVCRELFRLKHQIGFFERYLADYTKQKLNFLGKNIAHIPTSKVTLGFSDAERERALKARILRNQRDYDPLRDGLYSELVKAIETNRPRGTFNCMSTDECYPV